MTIDTTEKPSAQVAENSVVLVHVPLQCHGDHSYRTHSRAELLIGSFVAAAEPQSNRGKTHPWRTSPRLRNCCNQRSPATGRDRFREDGRSCSAVRLRLRHTYTAEKGWTRTRQRSDLAEAWQACHRHVWRGRDLQPIAESQSVAKTASSVLWLCLPVCASLTAGSAESVTKDCF